MKKINNKPIKIRRRWSINPRTKIRENKRKGLTKREIKQILQGEDL